MKETTVLIVIACIFIVLVVGQIAITNADTISVNVRDNESMISNSADASEASSSQRMEFININTASEDLLCEIDGIGEKLAQRIIEYRETNGNFICVEDLMKVYGIGEATFAKIKPFVTV